MYYLLFYYGMYKYTIVTEKQDVYIILIRYYNNSTELLL